MKFPTEYQDRVEVVKARIADGWNVTAFEYLPLSDGTTDCDGIITYGRLHDVAEFSSTGSDSFKVTLRDVALGDKWQYMVWGLAAEFQLERDAMQDLIIDALIEKAGC